MNHPEELYQELVKEGKTTYAKWLVPCCQKKNDSCRIAVVGERLRGKSTFINELLGQKLLPTGIIPTSCTITLKHGEKEQLLDAAGEPLKNSLADAVDDNDRLTLQAPNARLKALGASITEYPGLGMLHSDEDFLSLSEIRCCDCVVLVVSAEQLLSMTECNFIQYFCKYSSAKRIMVWIRKMDRIPKGECQRIDDYARSKLDAQFPGVKWWVGAEKALLPTEKNVVEKEQAFAIVEAWLQEVRGVEAVSQDAVLACLKEQLQKEYEAACEAQAQAEQKRQTRYAAWERQKTSRLTDLDEYIVQFHGRELAAKKALSEEIGAGFARMKKEQFRSYQQAADKLKWGKELSTSWKNGLDRIAEEVDQKAAVVFEQDRLWLESCLQNVSARETAGFRLDIQPKDAPGVSELKDYSRQKKVIPAVVAGGTVSVFAFMKILATALEMFVRGAMEHPETASALETGINMVGKTLDNATGIMTAAVLVVGLIVGGLKEKALPGKENEQAQQVKEILEDSLSWIETLAKEQAAEQIEKIYREEAGLLADEKARVQNEQFQEKEGPDNAEETVSLKKLLNAIESN